ncbi:hypothetical protein AGMMS49921_07330 [Endomicrobiia bacterium]|nr:hypothetical protein AGMMS49921_07320 [Endomicrobiia bacterium]GHT42358.1 hypothetical protein AGMMS49921_07330 [Endomicrobiia bacterium]
MEYRLIENLKKGVVEGLTYRQKEARNRKRNNNKTIEGKNKNEKHSISNTKKDNKSRNEKSNAAIIVLGMVINPAVEAMAMNPKKENEKQEGQNGEEDGDGTKPGVDTTKNKEQEREGVGGEGRHGEFEAAANEFEF